MYNTDLPTRAELPSARQLTRSTLIAAAAASVLLVGIVMPAEYGRDPLGTGSLLGLKKMGEIKVSLAQEARSDQSAPAPAPTPASAAVTSASTPVAGKSAPAAQPAAAALPTHVTSVTLKPGQAAEVKLDMRKGAEARFEWTAQGGTVNFDNHGDPVNPPAGFYHGYGKGRQVKRDTGVIKAAFDGLHGFFWRNRGSGTVTIELKTQGDYAAIKRML